MPLPPKAFYQINDIANRWEVRGGEIVGWAIEGYIKLSMALPHVEAGAQHASGLVEIAGEDVLTLFRGGGEGAETVSVRRFRRAGGKDWEWISKPVEGLAVSASSILVIRAEAERFERKWGIFGADEQEEKKPARPSFSPQGGAGSGAPPRHDWDSFNGAVVRYVHENGIPERQSDLIRAMSEWFASREETRVPDERTIRRKISGIWRELTRV